MHFAVIGMYPLKRNVGGKQKEKEEKLAGNKRKRKKETDKMHAAKWKPLISSP
jgi:hypothetical protein